MTNTFNHSDFALALANQMVKDRFGTVHGTTDLAEYFDFVDARQTAHLEPSLAKRVTAATGAQRRRIKFTLEDASTIIAKVPMQDPRRTGATIWAEVELGALLDLIENGADGAWCLNYSGKTDKKGYVKTAPPLASQGTATGVTVGRLIAGAGKGRSVRFVDRNHLNLRRSNLYLYGNPAMCERPTKRCKHDAVALVQKNSGIRASLPRASCALSEKKGKEA